MDHSLVLFSVTTIIRQPVKKSPFDIISIDFSVTGFIGQFGVVYKDGVVVAKESADQEAAAI